MNGSWLMLGLGLFWATVITAILTIFDKANYKVPLILLAILVLHALISIKRELDEERKNNSLK